MTPTATHPGRQIAFSRLYDALKAADVHLELEVTPDPPGGTDRGARGIAAAGVSILDPGAGRLTFTGTSIEDAARAAIAFGPEKAKDYGTVTALKTLRAQLQLDELGA